LKKSDKYNQRGKIDTMSQVINEETFLRHKIILAAK